MSITGEVVNLFELDVVAARNDLRREGQPTLRYDGRRLSRLLVRIAQVISKALNSSRSPLVCTNDALT